MTTMQTPPEVKDIWRTWRNDNDMSQATLARVLGLALRTVQGIESGEHKPSPTSRMRFKALQKQYKAAQ